MALPALCVLALTACESLVGIKDIVPIDGNDSCVTLEPLDFAIKDLGVVEPDGLFAPTIADVNGDRAPDFVWTGNTGKVLRNTTPSGASTTTFASSADTIPPFAGTITTPFVDINGDGKLDMVGNPGLGGVLNTTAAGSAVPRFDTGYFIDMACNGLGMARLDADNRPDIVGWVGTEARMRLNTTAAGSMTITFAAMVTVSAAPAGNNVTAIQVADMNLDGKPDLVIASENPSSHASMISVALNTTTTGALTFASRVDFAQPLTGPLTFTVADMDGDRAPDVIAAAAGAPVRLRLSRNTTPAQTTAVSFAATSLDDTFFAAIRDYNGDNKPDIIYYSAPNRSFVVRLNTTTAPGVPQFASPLLFTLTVNRILASDDLNNDGKPDAIGLSFSATTPAASVSLVLSGSHCAE